jgi:HEAT repeat protein
LAGDDAGRAAVEHVAQHDDDADLRWEAVRALARVNDGTALVSALDDAAPRVRAEAAQGLRGVASARTALATRLQQDHWPSVRAAAALSLAGEEANVPALLAALDDASVPVGRAVMTALQSTPGATIAPRLMTFAEQGARNPELRGEALNTLAMRCERGMATRIATLASRQIDPILPPPEQDVGHQALAALAHIAPVQARALLSRMQANNVAVAAVARAMRNPCPALTPARPSSAAPR